MDARPPLHSHHLRICPPILFRREILPEMCVNSQCPSQVGRSGRQDSLLLTTGYGLFSTLAAAAYQERKQG